MSQHILVIEDDPELGKELVRQLEGAAFTVRWLKDGDEAMRASLDGVDLVLLDLVLPGTYGLDILKRYRSTSQVPVVLLTARNHNADKVRGLSLGADDYVTKPFWPDELLARIRARLRRPVLTAATDAALKVGDIEIDSRGRGVRVGGVAIDLTPVEFELLGTLARNAGRAVARSTLLDETVDAARGGGERALDVHVSRLRKKLGTEGRRVATVWGIGYRLETGR